MFVSLRKEMSCFWINYLYVVVGIVISEWRVGSAETVMLMIIFLSSRYNGHCKKKSAVWWSLFGNK